MFPKKSVIHLGIEITTVVINVIWPVTGPEHAENQHHSLDFQFSYFIIPIKALFLGIQFLKAYACINI